MRSISSLSLSLSGALIGVSLFSGAILASNATSADVVDDVVITVPVSCNMTSELDTAHTATINPGQNQTDIGTTNFTVFCNDNSGYAIYAIGYSNEEYGNTKLLATINNQLTPTYDIITGTATSGATSNWSMKLNPVTGTYTPTIESDTNGSFASYHVVPTEYTKVATFASNTDFTIGSSLQSTYQAYIAGTQPAGTYAGKVKYTLVHPNDADAPETPFVCPANYICYHPNTEDAVGTMNVPSVGEYSGDTASSIGYHPTSSNGEVVLFSSNYSRQGYGFAAWNTQEDGTGINYGPNQTITTGNLSSHGLNLYAKWIPAEENITMQTFDKDIAPYSTASIGTVIALRDIRDSNVYSVAKLADGEWWMTENLRLDIGTANITSANTNNPSSTFLQQAQNVSSSSSWCDDASDSACTDQILYNTSNINRALDPDAGMHWDDTWSDIIDASWYSYGVYYNWYATTAGYGTKAFSDDSGYTVEINDKLYTYSPSTIGDICPSGWRVPVAYSDTGYILAESYAAPDVGSGQYLFLALGGGINSFYLSSRTYPTNFVLSGYYPPRTPEEYSAGLWTSSSGASRDESPNVINYAHSEGTNGINIGYLDAGNPIRCVAR